MARLTFQNVPTKSGGVISGNISTSSGSPFGAGGKYEAQVANIKAEIAKKPVGYYDPPPLTLWEGSNPVIESNLEDDPAVQKARERLGNLYGTYDPSHPRASNLGRFGSAGDIFAMQQKINQQEQIIADARERLLAEKNAPVIQAQQEQQAREADLERKLEIELAVQRVLDKQIINQRPTPSTSTSVPIYENNTDLKWSLQKTSSYLPFAVVGIVLMVILLFLRRRA